MKPLILFIGIIFCTERAYTQNDILPEAASVLTDEFILDSFYHWEWDPISLDWALSDRALYTSDDNQNVTSETSSELDSMKQWADQERTLNTYDENNQLINEVQQQWYGGAWVNVSQTINTYDSNKDQTVELIQNWDGSIWNNIFQLVFTYDNNHNQLTRTSQHWTGTDWADGTRQLSTYDGSNRLTMKLFQNYIGNWNDVSRSFYDYDINNDLDTILYQKWNFNAWVDDYRNLYDFDDRHNRILILEQLAVGVNVWEDQDRYDYTYDQYDHITHLLNSQFENNAWTNVYQYNLINDDDQNRATEVFQTWDNEWVNADSTQYYYTGITATQDFFDHRKMTILPNPTSDFLFVEYDEPINGTVAIYSSTGTKLLEFKSNHEQTFLLNVSSFHPGVYFVALQVGHQVLTKGFEKF